MHDQRDPYELTEHERALFAALPRAAQIAAGTEDATVEALRAEGYFGRRRGGARRLMQLAAAIAIFAVGGISGAKYAMRNSLERQLTLKNLSLNERVLLLQRAGSAYVKAANGYADATTRADSTAVEVASQVLLGAAHAVARRSLDDGISTQLTALFSTPRGPSTSGVRQ